MKPTLLIADSDAELCEVYRRFISERGFEVQTASDGLSCLVKLRWAMPMVVVLDVDLPWGGGNGVLAWLREERAASEVAVILTASDSHSLDSSAVSEPPVIGFLLKPFTLSALLDKVRSAIADGQEVGWKAGPKPALSELFLG